MSTVAPQRASTPMVLQVKGNALDDGPGIRSVVFLKGCPLSCVWCHNPESQRRTPELSYDASACVEGCTRCIDACPAGALGRGIPGFLDRAACTMCFACVEACPSSAMSRVGHARSVDELMTIVRRDKPFYDASGGGVTFSGGEPTLAMQFLGELAAACRAEGIHTLLQTAGHFRWKPFARHALPHIDAIYFDLKLADREAHRQFCGVPNGEILSNFARLAALHRDGGIDLLARIPLIPGITATPGNIDAIGDVLLANRIDRVRLLDYNPTWVDKTAKIGAANEFAQRDDLRTWLPRDIRASLSAQLESRGIATS